MIVTVRNIRFTLAMNPSLNVFLQNLSPTPRVRTLIRTPGERSQPPRYALLSMVVLGLAVILGLVSFFANSTPARAAQVNQFIIRAEGKSGTEQMQLLVNGEAVADWVVSTSAADYVFTPTSTIDVDELEVAFTNDRGQERDLKVDYVDIGGTLLQSEDPATTSSGTFRSGEGCGRRSSTSETLHCNGSFEYSVPGSTTVESAPPVDEILIAVRALGSTGAERIQIEINGTALATETLNTSYQTLTYVWPASTPITSAEVEFLNDSGPRDVRVDYIEIDEIRYQSEDDNTFSTGSFFDGSCGERFSTGEWLRCDGAFRYAIGGAPVALPEDPVPADDGDGADSDADEETEEQVESEEAQSEGSDDSGEGSEEEEQTAEEDTGESSEPDIGSDEIEISVRARGTTGAERIEIEINGEVIATQSLGTSYQTYSYPWPEDTEVTSAQVEFVNDSGPRDVEVDYLEVDNTRYQSEDADTFSTGTFFNGSCGGAFASREKLHCNGAFIYPIGGEPAVERSAPVAEEQDNSDDDNDTGSGQDNGDDDDAPARQVGSSGGRFSISQVIDGTISGGDGSNPNEEAPAGRHDAPLALNQGWNWAQGPTRNSVWGQLGTGGSQFAEFRCAVIPENGHTPSVPFRINVREGAYYQYVNGDWQTGFNVDLTGGNHGGYLGNAGQQGGNPFNEGSKGQIQWRRESDGSFSAPWNPSALMMHFWAAQREAPPSGTTAEFLTSEVRLQQPDGQTVDLSSVRVLFQCGVDYYSTTGGQGTQVPGPGIGKYHRATEQWQPSLWVTLPNGTPANSVSDFRNWLESNTPPNVG